MSTRGLTHVAQPPRRPIAGSSPCLLLVHGRGADEHDLLGLAEWLDPRLTIVSVRAPFPLGPGYHWYELVQIGAAEPVSYAASRAQLVAFVAALPAAFGVDPTRVYALGFSQGAVMTGGLLLAPPSVPSPRLAGAVLLSGYLPVDQHVTGASPDLTGLSIFVGHGRQDSLIPVAFGRHTRDELTALGAAVTYHEYPIAHAINEQELADIAAWLTARLDEGE